MNELYYEWLVTYIWETQEVWDNKLEKRMFVVEEDSDKEYKGSISFDLYKDKTALIDNIKLWDKARVRFNVKSREYNGKYYNSITAWRINKIEEERDDLPF